MPAGLLSQDVPPEPSLIAVAALLSERVYSSPLLLALLLMRARGQGCLCKLNTELLSYFSLISHFVG
jgi:hypothetical protein